MLSRIGRVDEGAGSAPRFVMHCVEIVRIVGQLPFGVSGQRARRGALCALVMVRSSGFPVGDVEKFD
jgi:hypothetical protein